MTPASVDASQVEITPFSVDQLASVEGFTCGDTDLDGFIRDDALRLQELNIVRTYVAFLGQRLVGYVALMADAVSLKSNERKKLRAASGTRASGNDHPVIPALKIARLAVVEDLQGNGVGCVLLRFALFTALDMAALAGCRLLTLDAYPEKENYYVRRKFERNLDDKYAEKEHPSMRYDIFRPDPPEWASRRT